jgi:hypothetical protein
MTDNDDLMRVCDIETEIQAILQVKLRRKVLWKQKNPFDIELMDAEIDEIRVKFPITQFSRNYNPKEASLFQPTTSTT